MDKPEKKDLSGMMNIHGRGSSDHCIGVGYNQACDDWVSYINDISKQSVDEIDNKLFDILEELTGHEVDVSGELRKIKQIILKDRTWKILR